MKKSIFTFIFLVGSFILVSKAYPCGGGKHEATLFSPAVAVASDVEEKTIKVSGMTCSKCSRTVEKAVKKVEGVLEANADYKSGVCKVKMKPGTDVQKILAAIKEAGYEPEQPAE